MFTVKNNLMQSGWVNRILLILATISLVDFLINGTYYKLIFTGVFVLLVYGISKLSIFKGFRVLLEKGVLFFKESNWFMRVTLILATNSFVDLVTTAAFYKLMFTGLLMFSIFSIIKDTKVGTVIIATTVKVIKKVRIKTTKTT